jgi:hypothetical protein
MTSRTLAIATALATAVIVFPGLPIGARGATRILIFTGVALVLFTLTLTRGSDLSRRFVIGLSIAGLLFAAAVRPVGSEDVNSYAVYGRIVVAHHANPYRVKPADFPQDPWYNRMTPFWHHTGSVYGPVFTGLSAIGMAVAGTSSFGGRFFFQLLALAAALGILALVDRRTRGDPQALVFFGLNPVVVAVIVNGGHNDLLVGLAVLAGIVLLDRGRPLSAGIVVALGALVKLPALLALGGLVAWALVHFGRRTAMAVGGASAVTVVAGYLLAGGRVALGPVLHASKQESMPSVWGYVRHLGDPSGDLSKPALASVVVLAAVLLLGRFRDPDPGAPASAALLGYLLAGSYVLSWYPGWALPSFATRWRDRLAWIAAAHAGLLSLAIVEPPSHLHGNIHTVEKFLHNRATPLVTMAMILYVVSASIRASTTPSARARISSSDRS